MKLDRQPQNYQKAIKKMKNFVGFNDLFAIKNLGYFLLFKEID
jgi:hypothetical protein